MRISYASNKLEKQLSSATEIKKAFGDMAKKVAARLDDIKSAPNLAILLQLPQANCHALKGNRHGEWAVSISGNYRIVFIIGHDPIPVTENELIDTTCITDIIITGTLDYH